MTTLYNGYTESEAKVKERLAWLDARHNQRMAAVVSQIQDATNDLQDSLNAAKRHENLKQKIAKENKKNVDQLVLVGVIYAEVVLLVALIVKEIF